jgi:hypothetical protein
VLPIPDALLSELAAAKARHSAERLALGETYSGLGYVVCDEAGEPYQPSTMSTVWQAVIKNLDVPQVRLHDARHANNAWGGSRLAASKAIGVLRGAAQRSRMSDPSLELCSKLKAQRSVHAIARICIHPRH